MNDENLTFGLMQDLYERLEYVRNQLGKTHEDLGKLVGISGAGYGVAIRRKSLRPLYVNILVEKLGLSKKYLETGEGDWRNRPLDDISLVIDYFKGNEPSPVNIKGGEHDAIPVTFNEMSVMSVPLVNQYGYGSYLNGYGDPEYVESLPTIPWADDQEHRGEYLCFEVRGDSMDNGQADAILERDILLCRRVRQEYWMSQLHINKWDFVIVHKEKGIVVKRIISHDVENGIIRLHPLNSFYDDYDVDLRDVAQIFNIVDLKRNRKR